MVDGVIARYVDADRFARHIGVTLLEVTQGYAKVAMPVQAIHLNGVGVVHGGAVFSLADCAFAVASNSHGTVALAINAAISYVRATKGGTLIAEAREIAINPKLATYEVTVRDDGGNLVALFQGTVYRKRERLEDVCEDSSGGLR